MGYKKNLAILTASIAGVTLAMHTANRIITYISTLDNNLNAKEGLYYNSRFGKIYYTKTGEGAPVLLLHDLETCSSEFEWNKIKCALSKTNTVYTLDLLGFGRSDKPNITYTNFLYVQLITNFLKDIVGDKTTLISSGSSSQIAVMAAAYNEENIDKIVLTNPSSIIVASNLENKLYKPLRYLYTTPVLGTFLYNIEVSKKKIEEKFFTDYFYNPEKIIDNDIKTYYESAHLGGQSSKYLFASIKGNYLNANIVHALKSIKSKVYVITSAMNNNSIEDDRCYLEFDAVEELILSNETGKYPHMECPDKYIQEINAII